MLSEIAVDAGHVEVSLVLPCLGCPALVMLKENVKRQVLRIDGVDSVGVRIDWGARWDRSLMSDRAKTYAAKSGYRI